MLVQPAPWELRLLSWAQEALTSPAIDRGIIPYGRALDDAYAYCARTTRTNSRTFFLASSWLPDDKRRAARALYAVCRSTDDMVDETRLISPSDRVFDQWRQRLCSPHTAAHDPVPLAWGDTQGRYRIPQGYIDQLIAGVSRDLSQTRYDSFADLAEYCYGVASTVGLMTMHIVGFSTRDALPYAVKLGIALQLTNILRDIGEDWRGGRLYLPLDELAAFGLGEADLTAQRVDDRWRDFMRFQIERVHRLYREAEPGIGLLDADGRFAIAAAAELYRAILTDIEAHDYDVFQRRARVGSWGKLRRLPGIWWRSRGYGRAPRRNILREETNV